MTNTKKVLLALTSHNDLGGVRATGYYVGEAAAPWKVFTDAGYTVDVASVAGGAPPEDGRDDQDPIQQAFLGDERIAAQLADTRSLADVVAADYDAVFYVGGHGTMWDFPTSAAVADIGRRIYQNGGVVSAVCHGPAALVNITLDDGSYLVDGKTVAGFTNEEESAVGLTGIVPFLLADKLRERGATHIAGPNFAENVQVDERLVTGQNPQSAGGVAREVVALLTP